jgi:anthranilate phosphoribosyltransferase
MNDVVTPVIARLLRREAVAPDDLAAALTEILEGRVSDVQSAGFIVALRAKGETVAEMAALAGTMRRFATHLDVVAEAIDTCGTGGDRAGTVNVSTMAALIAAGAGVRVVKHGNRAASSHCGSADVLEALGVAIDLGPDGVAACVDAAGIGFCFAPRYNPAMRFLGPARKELGVPTTFNFLGPLINPARVRRQVIGVSDTAMAQTMLGALGELGADHAMVFHGDDGLDELTTTTTSTVHELVGTAIRTYRIDPTEFGIDLADAGALTGGDAAANADHVRSVLAGDKGAHRDIAVLNTGAALVVAGIAADIESGVEAARAAIDDGNAAAALAALVETSTKAKASEIEAEAS